MLKNEKHHFTTFRQKRKTLCIHKVLGTLFRPETQKSDFAFFGSQKVEISTFSASGALLPPKTLQNAKVGPKVKKAVLGVLGSKNVPRTLRFPLFGARGQKDDFCQKVVVRRIKNKKNIIPCAT